MPARGAAISRCTCARLHPDWLVHGIDLEDDRVERCRTAAKNLALRNVSFSRDNLLNLSANSQYDLITNTDVLEHIEDDRGALANLARALAPGGYLLLTFPSVPQRRHLKLVAWRERRIGFKPEDIGHVRPGYSPEMINGLAREVGTRAGQDACGRTGRSGISRTICFSCSATASRIRLCSRRRCRFCSR